MTTTFDGKAFQAEVRRLDGLLREAARFADPAVQAHTRALLQAVLALHGAGLERVVAHMEEAGDAGRAVLNACADDEVAAGMLLLHDLHPLDLEARVRQAVERARAALRPRGGEIELIGVSDGVVRLRLSRGDDSRGATVAAMRPIVEEMIYGLAPEITTVEVEGEAGPVEEDGRVLVSLPLL
jgi:Fe-S cluster biogenesis protein NfuA